MMCPYYSVYIFIIQSRLTSQSISFRKLQQMMLQTTLTGPHLMVSPHPFVCAVLISWLVHSLSLFAVTVQEQSHIYHSHSHNASLSQAPVSSPAGDNFGLPHKNGDTHSQDHSVVNFPEDTTCDTITIHAGKERKKMSVWNTTRLVFFFFFTNEIILFSSVCHCVCNLPLCIKIWGSSHCLTH